MKLGMILRKAEPLKPKPFSPVYRARKFAQVFGTTSFRSYIQEIRFQTVFKAYLCSNKLISTYMTILPRGDPSAAMSKYTLVVNITNKGMTF